MAKIKGIYRYDESVQQCLRCKTKPEPWLHIAIAGCSMSNLGEHYARRNAGKAPKLELIWAVYVWDTREVIESGQVDRAYMDRYDGQRVLSQLGRGIADAMKTWQPAIDNHTKLNGKSIAQHLNDEFKFKDAKPAAQSSASSQAKRPPKPDGRKPKRTRYEAMKASLQGNWKYYPLRD